MDTKGTSATHEELTQAVKTTPEIITQTTIEATIETSTETTATTEADIEAAIQPKETVAESNDSNPVVETQPETQPETPSETILKTLVQKQSPTYSFDDKTKNELIEILAKSIQELQVSELKNSVEQIKIAFYKIHNAEIEEARKAFELENTDTEFVSTEDQNETRLKELINLYRQKRDLFIANIEQEKEANYKAKLQVIDDIKDLTKSSETVGNTFAAFRELQAKWKEIGLVPQANVRDLWETYNLHIEIFYNYVKINNELRDLDLKRNLEQKIELCEHAETLTLDASSVNAFHKLQKLHDLWREIGPVNMEQKDSIWERFKTASTTVNKRHQEHFDEIKDEQIKNLELKENLCAVVEDALEQTTPKNHKEWEAISNQIIETQKVWKTIGFAPKKDNSTVYERFRHACDLFFTTKKNYFESIKADLNDNHQIKMDICIQAEALANATNFKQATGQIKELQAKWKHVGPTSRKYSEDIWNRFRQACDTFFSAKAKFFEESSEQYEQNLLDKIKLMDTLKEIQKNGVIKFDALKEIQNKWSKIGFVPMKNKDLISTEYRELVDALFKSMRAENSGKRMDNFKEKAERIKDAGKQGSERDRLIQKIKTVESEILTLENNIGFFAHSKNAESLVAEVNNKIKKAKDDIIELKLKIKILD